MLRLVSLGFASIAVSLSVSLASTASAQESAPPATRPTVQVDLRTDAPRTTLERRASVQNVASFPEPACVAPCATGLDRRYAYRVSGQGLVPSSPFTLPQDRDHLVVDARMGSSVGRVSGLVVASGGVGALLLGGAALVAAPILDSQNVGTPALRTGVLAGGVGLVGLGALALGAGLWLWLHNDTSVRFDAMAASRPHTGLALTPSGIAF
jgi:hypothetical protein